MIVLFKLSEMQNLPDDSNYIVARSKRVARRGCFVINGDYNNTCIDRTYLNLVSCLQQMPHFILIIHGVFTQSTVDQRRTGNSRSEPDRKLYQLRHVEVRSGSCWPKPDGPWRVRIGQKLAMVLRSSTDKQSFKLTSSRSFLLPKICSFWRRTISVEL